MIVRKSGFAVLAFFAFGLECAAAQMSAGANSQQVETGPQVTVMGFGDIDYVSSDGSSDDGFAIGQGVAQINAVLDDKLTVFAEISLSARDSEYTIEAERFFARYDFSDLFKLSAGRYHTPIGYWNSAFHHGTWLTTTVSRPEMVKFGSKLTPIHFVGALLEGTLQKSSLGLSYLVGFGNGRHGEISRGGDSGDVNSDSAWMAQLNIVPDRIFGLSAGIGYYSDRVSPDGGPDIDEQIVSAYFAWANESPEIIIEYQHGSHEEVANPSAQGNTDSWYAQFAYRLKGKYAAWKPYARLEKDEVDATDPLLGDQGLNYEGAIFGARWDFTNYAALKGEYRREEFDNGGMENNFRVQFTFVLANL